MTEVIQQVETKAQKSGEKPSKLKSINLRFLFQQSEAGPIIGKGGSNIKAIIEKTGCSMNFFDEYHRNRTLVITGPKQDVLNAIEQVAQIMKSSMSSSSETDKISIYWVLAKENAMCLIGKQGINVKRIKETTLASVSVIFDNKNGARSMSAELLVKITGTPQQVASVIELSLNDFISDNLLNLRPYNFSKDRDRKKTTPERKTTVGMTQSKYKGPQQFHIESTQTIQLKREFAGAVIGKAGGNINRIRAYSGARINVRTVENEEDMSSVVVVGRPGCVARAFELIEDCIQIYLANGARMKASGSRNGQKRIKAKTDPQETESPEKVPEEQ